jgi:hypothetical protein
VSELEIGEEAREFLQQQNLREDAVQYAFATAAVDYEDSDIRVMIGHDPDGRRWRMTLGPLPDHPTRLLTVRPE